MNFIRKVKELISENKLEKSFEKLSALTKNNKKLERKLTLIKKRFKSIEEEYQSGGLTKEERVVSENIITVSILKLLDDIEKDLSVFSLDLIESDENDFMRTIFDENFSNISRIYVLGYTGRNLISNFHNLIFSTKKKKRKKLYPNKDLEIKVLLKNPYSEDKDRYNQIYDSVNRLKRLKKWFNKKIDLKFYESIPVFRGIICEFDKKSKLSNKRVSILTNYYWLPLEKPIASDYSFIENENIEERENEYVEQVFSWFEHFWGQEEVHTIIFDFDDTLVKTIDLQIRAWVYVIIEFYEKEKIKIEWIREDIKKELNGSNNSDNETREETLIKTVEAIFLKEQMAGNIFDSIFENIDAEMRKELKPKINERRFEIRHDLTINEGKMFDGAKEIIKTLSKKYQLVIISSTSEELIEDWLWENDMLGYFSKVYGKLGPIDDWDNVPDKSKLIIRHSKNSGISLDRIVFIGDNNTDYNSSRLLNIFFIEARIIAGLFGIETLISYKDSDKIRFFKSYKGSNLLDIIADRNKYLRKRKWKLKKEFL